MKNKPDDLSDTGWEEMWDRIKDYDTRGFSDSPVGVKENWDKEIAELEAFCLNIIGPLRVEVSPVLKTRDARRFVEIELEVIRANNGNPTFRSYLDRAIAVMNTVKKP